MTHQELRAHAVVLLRNWWFAVVVLIGVISVVGLIIGTDMLRDLQLKASNRIEHNLEVGARVSALNADVETMVSKGRAYVIGKSGDYRANFDAVVARIDADLMALRAFTASDPDEVDLVDRLRPLVAERVAAMRETLDLADAGDPDATRLAAMTRRGEDLTSPILAISEALRDAARQALAARREAAAPLIRLVTEAVAMCATLTLATVFLALVMTVRRARDRLHLAEVRHLNAELEARALERVNDLARSQARLRGLFDKAPIGLHVVRARPDGHFVHEDLNPASQTLFGLPREQIIDRALHDIWPAPVARKMEAKLRDCIESGRPVQYAISRALIGGVRHLDVLLAPIEDETGERDSVLVCVRDVTKRRALEERIVADAELQAQAAEREMAFFRGSPDGLFVVGVRKTPEGPEFVYEVFNPAFERITGLRPADLVGRGPLDGLSPELGRPALERYGRCVLEGVTITYGITQDLPIGRRDIEGMLTPIRHSVTGEIVRLAGHMRDVTQRNRLESEMRHTQRMDAIGKLSAGVAHDFNNLLQSIVSALELVLDDVRPGTPAHDYADLAFKAAQRGASLTRHLLAYARKQMLLPQAIALAPFLTDMQRLFERSIGARIAIDVLVDPNTPPIFADPGQLQTALLNLAINASHAMMHGGTLTLEVRERATASGVEVTIAVADTGTGMDAETLAHATDPFFTTKGVDGSGLGLSMVKGFVEQSGGRFHLTSTFGVGTTVELCLPLAMTPERDAGAPRVTPASSASGRILLVDDAPDVLVTTGAFLTKAGFEVTRAKTGNEALTLLASGTRFDALVTDYAMPGLNGADLIVDSRLIQPGLPALIITGFAAVNGDGSLPDDVPVLHKPISRLNLIENVLRIVSPGLRAAEDTPALAVRGGELPAHSQPNAGWHRS